MTVPVALFGVWLAAGIGAALIVYHVLTRPGTIEDLACASVDDDLNAGPSLVGSPLDTTDSDDVIRLLADEMVDDIAAWLTARTRFEQESGQ